MRNDEKIDIDLADGKKTDNLSEEELAEKNYETALRYINIAEHMKKFEDQDKYYHRAIQYLKKVREYREVRPLLRKLRKKKFNARAQGKISLYKEASQIRDKAKTPSDYYAAQTIFYRIHKYEETHALIEKWTTPEIYAEAIKCSDSEEQAKICERLAAEKAAELKRHSFFVSCVFIAVIAAVLVFTRTIAFRECLGSAYKAFGDYESAWQAYEYIEQKNNSTDAHQNYLFCRYKAAVKALSDGDNDTAYTNFKALAKEDYKDSAKQFVALEQNHILNTKPGDKVSFAYMDWRVLAKEDDKVLLLKDNSLGSTAFQENGGKATWKSSSVRKWLNSSFLSENFLEDEQNIINETQVTADQNPTYGTSGGADTTDKVFLLSAEEVNLYKDTIHTTKTCWWLRTPGAIKGSMCFVYPDKTVMDYGYDSSNTSITVKPAIWVTVK